MQYRLDGRDGRGRFPGCSGRRRRGAVARQPMSRFSRACWRSCSAGGAVQRPVTGLVGLRAFVQGRAELSEPPDDGLVPAEHGGAAAEASKWTTRSGSCRCCRRRCCSAAVRRQFSNGTHLLLTFARALIYSMLAMQWTVSLFDPGRVLFRESEINWRFWIKKRPQAGDASGLEALFVYLGRGGGVVLRQPAGRRAQWQGPDADQPLRVVLGVPLVMVRLLNVDGRRTRCPARRGVGGAGADPAVRRVHDRACGLLRAWLDRGRSPAPLPEEQMREARRFLGQLLRRAVLAAFLDRGDPGDHRRSAVPRRSVVELSVAAWESGARRRRPAVMFGFLHMNAAAIAERDRCWGSTGDSGAADRARSCRPCCFHFIVTAAWSSTRMPASRAGCRGGAPPGIG